MSWFFFSESQTYRDTYRFPANDCYESALFSESNILKLNELVQSGLVD